MTHRSHRRELRLRRPSRTPRIVTTLVRLRDELSDAQARLLEIQTGIPRRARGVRR
jgi:hypothetical protein